MDLIQITPLPQLVPSRTCLSCDVCCRFPEPDSFLRPYFTAEEIRYAVTRGVEARHFPDASGCQVSVVPHPAGDGYLCPAFDPDTSHCRIYEGRPLDCQLYPYTVMWSREGRDVVLGWDAKCPFMLESAGVAPGARGERPELYAERIARLVERAEYLEPFIRHPSLVAPFQEDVTVVRALPRLTERLAAGCAPALKPLDPDVMARFAERLKAAGTPLSSYHLAPHLVWTPLLTYSWAELHGHLCLFAENNDGLFMPLPPLSLHPTPHPSRLTEAIAEAVGFMRARNHGSAVTRIENVAEETKPALEGMGYRLRGKDPEYLYQASDLAGLRGDRYKSQRAACNRFVRSHSFHYEPYRKEHREACLKLLADWASQQRSRRLDEPARAMLEDAQDAHREALASHAALGLTGRIVRVDGAVRAYTFGYERNPDVFCVLFEVADRTIAGLAQWLFREVCREMAGRGVGWINTLDDSGLTALAASKRAYRPARLVPSYILTEA